MNPRRNTHYLLLDVDHTLIDTDALHRRIRGNLPPPLSRLPQEFSALIRLLTYSLKTGPQQSWFINTLLDPTHYRQSVYPEAVEVLTRLASRVNLGILSQAFPRLQLLKLHLSGLYPFFQKHLVFINRDKRRLATSLLPKLGTDRVSVVDDIPEMTAHTAQLGTKAFLIDRKGNKILPQGVTRIRNLGDLLSYFS